MSGLDVNRREFIKIAAGAGAALAMPGTGHATMLPQDDRHPGRCDFVRGRRHRKGPRRTSRTWRCEYLVPCGVHLWPRYCRKADSRANLCPITAKQEYDLNFHGGNFATPHPQYYRNTVIEAAHAPDHGDLDILAEVIPAANKRGLKVICWMEDVFRSDLPNIEKVQERDLYGRNRRRCASIIRTTRISLPAWLEDYTPFL